MIVGNLATIQLNEKVVSQPIREALEYLRKTDLEALKLGMYALNDFGMSVNVFEYVTEAKARKIAEQHKKFLDVHYVILGQEIIGVSFDHKENEILEGYSEEKDCVKYGVTTDETDVVMTVGMYAVFFPEDIHRPGCAYREAGTLKKAVIKIPVALL